LVLVLPFFNALFFSLKKWKPKILILGVIFAGLWLLANAVSRISIVAYLAAVGLTFAFLKKYRAGLITLLATLVIFSFSGALGARFANLTKIFGFRPAAVVVAAKETVEVSPSPAASAAPVPVVEDRSTSIRLKVEWPRAIRAWAKNPLLGTGYSSLSLATDNDFLRLLGEAGILGLAAFVLLLFNLGRYVKKAVGLVSGRSDLKAVFLVSYAGALFGVLLNSFFIDIFEASKFAIIFWFFTGMFVSMVNLNKNEKTN
jgi:O-antigen ligase